MSGAVPVTLVTGFLGAGKTTLLRRLLAAEHGRRLAVVVNDFGAIGIDAEWVREVVGEREMVRLTNGCICCSIRGDLLEAVAALASQPEPPEQVIVETSGVSDPQQLVQTFTLVEIATVTRLDAVITVLDAAGHDALVARDPELAVHQAAAADLVLLNKIDVASPEARERARHFVARMAPRARVFETTACDVPAALVLAADTRADRSACAFNAPHEHAHRDRYTAFAWTSPQPLAVEPLAAALGALPASVLRGKGIVYAAEAPEEQAHLNYVGARMTLTRGGPWRSRPQTRLEFIALSDPGVENRVRAQLDAVLAGVSRGGAG
jgi:G3E family GTPase